MKEQECTAALAEIVESPRVRYLLARIYTENRSNLRRGITCRICRHTTCHDSTVAYYSGNYQRERINDKNELEDVLLHELVHAYDAQRYPGTNCYALACSEIRASFHGECRRLASSVARRNCTLHHAIESTKRYCPDAEYIITRLFEQCATQPL